MQVEALQGSLCPNIDRPIDNTAMSQYMTCPREYFLGMVLHRRSKGRSAALCFGSAWHKAMEIHYKTNGDQQAVHAAVMLAWEEHGAADDYRTWQRVIVDYDKYLRQMGLPVNEPRKTVGFPHEPLVELSFNAMGGGLIHPWAGKLDRIYKQSAFSYIEDHKTTSRLDKNYFSQFFLSNQMKGYTFLGKQAMPSEKVIGVRINLSHVLTNKTEFHSELFTYNQDEIDEWVAITNVWLTRLNHDYGVLWELAEKYDNQLHHIPWSDIDTAFPAHFGDNACSRKFGMCGYHEVCKISGRNRNKLLESKFDINPWNPLEMDEVEL